MTEAEPQTLRDYFLLGVWNSTYEERFNGGPICSRESTFGFKFAVILVLVSPLIILAAIPPFSDV